MYYVARKTGNGTEASPTNLYWLTQTGGFFSGDYAVERYKIKGYKRLGNARRIAEANSGLYDDCVMLVLNTYNGLCYRDHVVWSDEDENG